MAASAMATLGAAGALVGLAGLAWRWFPMAMPAQGLWRLSSTLTYVDAAGLVLAACLLLAFGCDRNPALVRAIVCLTAAGLLATQSRGAYLALACACFVVPARRYAQFAIPLLAGAGLGVAAIASSQGSHQVPWLAALVVVAVAIAIRVPSDIRDLWSHARKRTWIGAAVLCACVGVGLLVHHEVVLRALAPSDQDRTAEWTSALHQWASAPFTGVGPDRLLVLRAPDGTLHISPTTSTSRSGPMRALLGSAS